MTWPRRPQRWPRPRPVDEGEQSADPIVWEGSIDDGAADAPRRMRVTKLLAQSGVESFIVEVHTQDAQKRDAWLETDDYVDTGAAAWATVEAQWKELEELRRRASAREVLPDLRERTSVELADALGVDVTTRWPVLLDKVRDLAVTDCAPASQTAAAARVEFRKRLTDIEETTAGKAETLEAVRSLTDALQALEGRLADVEASVGQPGPLDALENRVERLEGHIEHRAWTAITQRVEALEMKVDDLAAGWGSCGPARPDEKREAVIREHEAGYREAPLDLATLRVSGQATGASENAVSFRPAGHALDIVVAVRVLPEYGGEERCEWATVDPHSARIIARALTQWADGAEKGAGK